MKLQTLMIEEKNWNINKTQSIIGADEVGRGSLAGPIVGAAVKLKYDHIDLIKDVKDSKKLSPKKREEIFERVNKNNVEYAISERSNLFIDNEGISVANKKVLSESIKKIYFQSDKVYVDHFKIDNFGSVSLVRGEDQSYSVALASIIAKVYRDDLMVKYSKIYPKYKFEKNKGYGTMEHRNMIKKYGSCDIHRVSFNFCLLYTSDAADE